LSDDVKKMSTIICNRGPWSKLGLACYMIIEQTRSINLYFSKRKDG